MSDNPVKPVTVTIDGVTFTLRDMKDVPKDGTSVLVLLESKSLHSRWHTAMFKPNVNIIGHHFSFDVSKPLGWLPLPVLEEP